MSDIAHWTEDDAEVMVAAKALAAYYDGTDEDAETWIAGAVVALNATNYKGAVEDLARLKRHVNHAPIVILDDGVYCGQCGGHVIEWGQ